jgi:hypothetical protein
MDDIVRTVIIGRVKYFVENNVEIYRIRTISHDIYYTDGEMWTVMGVKRVDINDIFEDYRNRDIKIIIEEMQV